MRKAAAMWLYSFRQSFFWQLSDDEAVCVFCRALLDLATVHRLWENGLFDELSVSAASPNKRDIRLSLEELKHISTNCGLLWQLAENDCISFMTENEISGSAPRCFTWQKKAESLRDD